MSCPLDYWFNLGSEQCCPDSLSPEDGTSPYSAEQEQRLKRCINKVGVASHFFCIQKNRAVLRGIRVAHLGAFHFISGGQLRPLSYKDTM